MTKGESDAVSFAHAGIAAFPRRLQGWRTGEGAKVAECMTIAPLLRSAVIGRVIAQASAIDARTTLRKTAR